MKQLLTENQKTWLAALRSGKYKKGTGCLNQDDKFCCLGVACEIFKEYHTEILESDSEIGKIIYDGEDSEAPPYVQDALGLINSAGSPYNASLFSMINLNDRSELFGKDKDFDRIADFIEENATNYFKGVRGGTK